MVADLYCGILFSTYDLLISSKPLSKEEKAQLKAAKAAEKWTVQQGKDDGAADKIQFGVRLVSDAWHDTQGEGQIFKFSSVVRGWS